MAAPATATGAAATPNTIAPAPNTAPPIDPPIMPPFTTLPKDFYSLFSASCFFYSLFFLSYSFLSCYSLFSSYSFLVFSICFSFSLTVS
jgi:hypothetical protein